MSNHASDDDPGGADKAATRAVWAMGDYDRFARDLVWTLGAELVRAGGITSGQRVLDVAAGSGNAALQAASVDAQVVACDLTPENFAAGQRAAEEAGLSIEWVEGDAESLPFPDASFDAVISSVGAMWAPDHQSVADEMARVCSPGGRIAMINFAADGLLADFLDVFGPYAPPPDDDAQSPLLWGSEPHVRALFGNRVDQLEMTRGVYTETVPGGPQGYCDYYRQTFGPVVATYASLADEPDRVAQLDTDFLAFATGADHGLGGGPAELDFEYLCVVGRRAEAAHG